MKKFYLLIMALVSYAATTMAQCPASLRPQAFTIPGTPIYCKLFVSGGPVGDVGTDVRLFLIDGFGNPIPSLKAGNPVYTIMQPEAGNTTGATVEYNCQGIQYIQIDYFVGGVLKQCISGVPPPASLPIKLSSFNGRLSTETEATISWTSSLEENSFKYEVQRSADGKNFVTIGSVNAAGTSVSTLKYSYDDRLPGTGAYFYRLKLVDQDGFTEFSKTVYVNSKKGTGEITKIFPNPFTSEIQLIGATSADLNSNTIKVFTVTGQRVNFRITGANAIAIDPNSPRGVYILMIKDKAYKLSKEQ